MNILVPHSWLKEYLETPAAPKKIAACLSLCSQSVEKTTKVDNDWIYDIEITTNRPDCLSIYGLARELAAILPRFQIKARLKPPTEVVKISRIKPQGKLSLNVKISQSDLCPRFTALIFDQIKIKHSPKIIQERLEKSGVRALNNVVDISNYLMLELGQPMHTFDYDQIKNAKMILRESRMGEKITTLDETDWELPPSTIIIEDGQGRIIDLCGIMGGQNSAVAEKTKRVLLFIQTYNPQKIRQTCQKMAFHTDAAARFEKGVNPEGVIPALEKAVKMFQDNCQARVASDLIDIYPNPPQTKKIKLNPQLVSKIMGIKITGKEITNILQSLGFEILEIARPRQAEGEAGGNWKLEIKAPSWRLNDISLPEDLIEEIARLYGYHRLPSYLMSTRLPQDQPNPELIWEKRVKDFLSCWGLTETASYSLQGKELIEKCRLDHQRYLKVKNPLSQELVYLRGSLIPSLLEIIKINQANFEKISLFEIANIYLKQAKKLPEEKPILIVALFNQSKSADLFYRTKGIAEALFQSMGIQPIQFNKLENESALWHPGKTTFISCGKNFLGILGEIHPRILAHLEIERPVAVFNLNFNLLAKLATTQKTFKSLPQFPAIIEDLCFLVPEKTEVGKLIQLIKDTSSIIKRVDLIDSFKNQRTFRITYQYPKKTLNDKEVEKIRKKIIKRLKNETQSRLKVAS